MRGYRTTVASPHMRPFKNILHDAIGIVRDLLTKRVLQCGESSNFSVF
jgi:hypothetical protein